MRVVLAALVAIALMCGGARAQPQVTAAATVVYRVNAGGPAITGTPSWTADTTAAPSSYVNAAATGNTTFSTTTAIDTTDPSVPAGTPAALFQTERWDAAAAPELQWNFPVTPGAYTVRLYFAEIYSGAQSVGARVFDVSIEGSLVLDNFDVFAAVGGYKGIVKTFQVTSDATLTIDFGHVTENPAVKAIEILQPNAANQLGASPSSVDFGSAAVNSTQTRTVQLTNLGAAGDPSISVSSASVSGADASQFAASLTPTTLPPGASTNVTVTFKPTTAGSKSGTLSVTHSGTNSPLSVPLAGTGGAAPVGFGKSVLGGTSSASATSLQFGPDNRLYVGQQNGAIKVYTVARNGPNSYAATVTETITLIQSIPNHNDDGTLNSGVTTRQLTGIYVAGTATNPVIYASSSDPRIGGGSSGQDTGLDTNSGVISKLTWNGSSWQKLDLVRGLPRSEENHSTNGLQYDAASNALYVSQGGNTNRGAPSNNFALLPEYALSGAVLKIDLAAIGNTTYDLPTLDDDTRAGTADAGDPFGGNDGKNQAKLVAGGPVQVYSPGFRNPYDLVRTAAGRMYTIDNGSNAGWGAVPVNEGPAGTCTNAVNEPGTTDQDSLHLLSAAGYYGGHPNPTRGNTANTFDSPPQSPVPSANPVECDYRIPGSEVGITTFSASTNGIAEYTASNFGGALKGDLVAASFDNTVYRVKLDASGAGLVLKEALFSTVGNEPLDVTTQGDAAPFPGTIWVANHGDGTITVFEPNDFGGGGTTCTGVDSTTLDEDGDGFTNHDEITNGTNPCSAADVPHDWDGDKVSDLNDPDDDNDGSPDTSDPFAIDASNGTTTSLPVRYTWDNDAPPAGGLVNLGFTGLMTNGTSNYASLFDATKMTAGGAAGVTTVDKVPDGDAFQANNNQQYGFQFGVKAPATGTFTAHTRIVGPFAGLVPQDYQSMGLFVGNGGQDDYVKLVTSANGGAGGIEFLKEVAGVTTPRPQAAVAMPGPDAVDLYLTIDPVAATVQPSYSVTTGGVGGPRTTLGAPEPIPPAWLAGPLAIGLISTSFGPAPEFAATWDLIEVAADPDTVPPAVSITAPAAGATVSGTANVTAAASDNAGVAGVQFKLDGANLGAEDTSAPYGVAWDTTKSANGSHVLTAVARDAAGNQTTSSAVTVTVANSSTGLVAAYNFDEGSGTTVTDRSGAGNTGSVSNATWTTAGKSAGALSFNGTNASVTIADAPSLDLTTAMTVEAWANPTALGSVWRPLVLKERASGISYSLYANETSARPAAQVFVGPLQTVLGSVAPALNTWTHLAATFDGATLKLYVNGALVGSKAAAGSIVVSKSPLRIGGTSTRGEWFAGRIDDVRVYKRALSQPEIQADLNTPVG